MNILKSANFISMCAVSLKKTWPKKIKIIVSTQFGQNGHWVELLKSFMSVRCWR